MSEDILKTAEKYLFHRRLTPADMEDAPRVIRALAGKFHGQRVHGVEVLEEGELLRCLSETDSFDYRVLAQAILKKFKVTVR